MTVQECYKQVGGDYDEAMSRLRTDDRIKRFLLKVADDQSYNNLRENLKAHNMEEAFRAAHTLKGVSSNLSLTKLHDSASEMTEALRGKTEYTPDLEDYFQKVTEDYELTVGGIRAID